MCHCRTVWNAVSWSQAVICDLHGICLEFEYEVLYHVLMLNLLEVHLKSRGTDSKILEFLRFHSCQLWEMKMRETPSGVQGRSPGKFLRFSPLQTPGNRCFMGKKLLSFLDYLTTKTRKTRLFQFFG